MFWLSYILSFLVFFLHVAVCTATAQQNPERPAIPADALSEAQNARQQGRMLDKAGNYPAAIAQYEHALNLFRAAGDQQSEADLLSDMAVVHRKQGELDQSLTLQQQAAAIYAARGDIQGQAKALRRLGVLYRHQGNLFQAIAVQEEALGFMQQAHDQKGIAMALTNLGTIYGDLGRLQDARSYFERASQIYTELQDQEGLSYTLGNLGQLFLYLGDSQQSLQYLDQSLAIKRALADSKGEANTLLNTGIAYKNLGDFQQALTFYYQALELYKQIHDSFGEAATLGSIGSLYEEMDDLDRARQFQLRSLDFKRINGTPVQLTIALTNLASLAIKQGALAEADAYLREGLAIATDHNSSFAQANIYTQTGVLALHQNRFEEAFRNLTQALALYQEIGSQKGVLEVLDVIGQLYLQQERFGDAVVYYEQAFQLARKLNDLNALWTIRYRLGQIALNKGDDTAASEHFKASVEMLEQMRSYLNVPELRRLFLRKNLNPYTQMIRLLLRRQQVEEALLYLERFKARTFLESVAYGEPQFHAAPALLQEEQYVSARIRYLNDKLSHPFDQSDVSLNGLPEEEAQIDLSHYIEQELYNAKEQYEQLLLRIKLQYPEYYRLKTVDADEIQQFIHDAVALIEPDVVILEYFLDETAIHIWIIEHNQIRYTAVPISYEEIIKTVLTFRSEIIWYESKQIYEPLRTLYTWLIAPTEPYLEGKTTIGVVPFQILHFVPFSALISDPFSLETQTPGMLPSFLIERYALFALPSLSLLPVVRHRTIQNAASPAQEMPYYVLGIGSATDELPGANDEIQTLMRQFPHSKGYIGNDATKQHLFDEAGQYNIIHLATHGVYDKQHPMFSYLEFGPESYVYAREIFGLQLGANLVTLSGCETLLPQQIETQDLHTLVSGDELVGFVRAFMYAGTPSVLSSLWRVSDIATQHLMKTFYHDLPQIGKAKSLQKAAQSVIRTTIQFGRRKKREISLTHPFFWSSFVLIGDWK